MKNVILLEVEEYEKLIKCKDYIEHRIYMLEEKVKKGEQIGKYYIVGKNQYSFTELDYLKGFV